MTTGALLAINSLADEANNTRFHSMRTIYQAHHVSGELQLEEDGSTDSCARYTKAEAAELPPIALTKLGIKHAFS